MWVSLWVDRGNKYDNNNDNYVAVDWLTGVLLWLAAAVVCGCWRHICTIKILFRLISRRLLFSLEINYGKFFNVLCYLLLPKYFFILCGHVIYCCWQKFIELNFFGTGIRRHLFITLTKLDQIHSSLCKSKISSKYSFTTDISIHTKARIQLTMRLWNFFFNEKNDIYESK